MAARGQKGEHSSVGKIVLSILFVFVVLVVCLGVAYFMNHITNVQIEGNSFYTEEEIQEMIMDGELEHNALYLYWKYNYSELPSIPFIDKIEVELVKRGSVKIRVYEKSIVGYVEYLGSCMYFDKDGTVVESSAQVMEAVPKIIGLQFDRIALYEKLPVEKDEVFKYILNLTKELKKNEILPDKIQFNDELEATLYFGQAEVLLGRDENQNEKITRLKALIPELEGKNGTLHMEEVDEDNKNIIFRNDTISN